MAPAAAAQLYADAFQAEPALADDLQEGDRFTAGIEFQSVESTTFTG